MWLPPEFLLKFEGGKTVTVADVLENKQAWNRKPKVMHPFYGGKRGKGMIFTLPRRTTERAPANRVQGPRRAPDLP